MLYIYIERESNFSSFFITGFLVNSLSFCFSMNVFISPCLKMVLLGTQVYYNALVLFHCLLASVVTVENSAIILIVIPFWMICFSLPIFKIFSVNILLQRSHNFVQELGLYSLLITTPFLILLSIFIAFRALLPYSVTMVYCRKFYHGT